MGWEAMRDGRSLTYSTVTHGHKSDVKLMIGDDGRREGKRGGACQKEGNRPGKIYSVCKSDRLLCCGLNELTVSKVNLRGR